MGVDGCDLVFLAKPLECCAKLPLPYKVCQPGFQIGAEGIRANTPANRAQPLKRTPLGLRRGPVRDEHQWLKPASPLHFLRQLEYHLVHATRMLQGPWQNKKVRGTRRMHVFWLGG